MRNNAFLHLGQAATEDNICLAVSPSMKALGVKNRCRIKDIPGYIKHIVAQPRMQLYIDCAAEIYAVFLKYIAPEDIHVYSIDESFLDVTPYLAMYKMTAKEIAVMIIKDVKDTVGTICTCGIGTNLYLAKIALDIKAKHAVDFPCIGFSSVFFISALQLYARCDEKNYVVIKGTCTEIEKTGLRRKVKDIYVKEDQFTVRIVRPTMKLRSLNVGDRITIYLADNAPVYEMDGCKVICNTLAVEKEYGS